MSSSSDWEMPPSIQPKPQDYAYDLDAALISLVGLRGHATSEVTQLPSRAFR